ncbi:MAG: ArgR family transcriptional regulator [Spirochaetaceae bacterium]|nr:MAG: ArgR family transcriptional regulator [Spirochaetaceae bacterium]
MKERPLRLQAIKKIIRANRITSQEQLLRHLNEQGFHVTQATLSRDLKLLKVGKIAEGPTGYAYTLPSEEERRESERSYVQDFLRGYVSIELSGPAAVVRTLTGHADSVGFALDNLSIPEILGTVAGNDTVIAILREGTTREALLLKLKEKAPEFEE